MKPHIPYEDLVDLMHDAIQNVHDQDSTTLTFAKAAAEVVMSLVEWQPIETAPKTGERIMVWASIMDTCVCVSSSTEGLIRLYQPTHWMPLPEPPQGDNA
jgi:hypothetical protein